ncbi:intermediate filament tail domain protein [Ancylostoma duodenale]|uniref:Intermediate filament tail domain protein n=1 Tax=Ancylostoma duodenale TaxID=51022 RepID=A0A0C2FTC1_9BILA|nr:intermediate filament tail domain protein [Ancylostoma duodenale]
MEKEVRGLTADLTDIRSRYDAAVKARNLGNEDDLIVKLCDLQAQICMTKRRNAVIDEECKRIRAENLKLSSDLAAQRQKLDKYKYQDTTEENRAIFRQGLLEAIAEIRKLYDEDTSKFRSEMESWYSKQVIEIRTSSRLAADASNTKNLDAEISKYRQLLEGEENRTHGRVISTASHSFDSGAQSSNYLIFPGFPSRYLKTVPVSGVHVRSSAMRRVTAANRMEGQRSAQGNVSILDVAPDGSSITIENTSVSHDEMIGEWRLRSFGGGRDVSFNFPRGFVLTPKSKVTVYARGKGVYAPPHSLVFEAEDSFATGGDVHTYLYNDENQVRTQPLYADQ